MEFVAIDFETANHNANSACQLAAVTIRDGQIADEKCWLIRPPGLRFSPHCIAVHGIRPEQVVDKPTFEQIWSELAPLIDGQIVVAHNARFDIGVLIASLATYDIATPNIEFSCTRLIARRCWPGRNGYGLKPTATSLGIEFQHHDALEDSRVCAQIALAAGRIQSSSSFDSLENSLRISRGTVRLGAIAGPRALTRPGQQTKSRASLTPTIDNPYQAGGWPKSNVKVSSQLDADKVIAASRGTKPLEGRVIVFSGKIFGMENQEIANLAERLGARCQPSVTVDTDYLVLGVGSTAEALTSQNSQNRVTIPSDQVQSRSDNDLETGSSVAEPGSEYSTDRNPQVVAQSKSKPTRVLSERQFLALLPGGSAAVQTNLTKRAK